MTRATTAFDAGPRFPARSVGTALIRNRPMSPAVVTLHVAAGVPQLPVHTAGRVTDCPGSRTLVSWTTTAPTPERSSVPVPVTGRPPRMTCTVAPSTLALGAVLSSRTTSDRSGDACPNASVAWYRNVVVPSALTVNDAAP